MGSRVNMFRDIDRMDADAWAAYLKTVADEHPELSNVVNNVFSRLDRRL